jgi:hypothetical protein
VAVGLTATDPASGSLAASAPLIAHEVALEEVQARLLLLPLVIDAGVAVIATDGAGAGGGGGGALAPTATCSERETRARELRQVTVYVVVAAGETLRVPEVARVPLQPPLAAQVLAPLDDQVSVDEAPAVIDTGEAVKLSEGVRPDFSKAATSAGSAGLEAVSSPQPASITRESAASGRQFKFRMQSLARSFRPAAASAVAEWRSERRAPPGAFALALGAPPGRSAAVIPGDDRPVPLRHWLSPAMPFSDLAEFLRVEQMIGHAVCTANVSRWRQPPKRRLPMATAADCLRRRH